MREKINKYIYIIMIMIKKYIYIYIIMIIIKKNIYIIMIIIKNKKNMLGKKIMLNSILISRNT